MQIKAKIHYFDEDGQPVGRSKLVDCYFPSLSRPLTLNISFDYNKKTGVSTEVELKLKDILRMVFSDALDRLFKDKS